jgi:acyl-CoA hydrolase
VLEADPEGKHVHWFSTHFSGYDRRKHDAGMAHYLPVNLGEVPDYYRRFIDPPDIVVFKTAPMDAQGYFNFGPNTLWMRALVERGKVVIVEETPTLPYVMGEGTGVHVSEVDYIIPGYDRPMAELPKAPATEVDKAVARLIAAEVEDGSCLQIGIGGMPNAVCSLLAESPVKDLGIHTEMMTDGIVDLYRAGRVTGARKQLNPGKMVCTFALGAQYLYDFIDRNPEVEFHPVDYTNLPTTSCGTTGWCRSTTPPRSTCRGRRRPRRTGSGISRGPAGSCSSCGGPMGRRAGRASCASPPPTTRRASGRAGS